MNDRVDEIAEEKVAEGVAEGDAGEPGALETAATDTGERPVAPAGADAPRRIGGVWRHILTFIFLFAVLAGTAGYVVFTINKERQAGRAEIQSLVDRFDELQQGQASLTEQARGLDSRLARTDEQVIGILHNLGRLQRQREGGAGWHLTELRYLFRVASQRLALAGDVDTAQALLQSADVRLRDLPDPALIPVREQLIADLNRLKSFPRTDFSGLVLALGDLAARSEQFPLKPGAATGQSPAPVEAAVGPDPDKGWQRLFAGLWQELKSLLVISRTDTDSVALLVPRERFFLQRNLRLQLEAARLAVLLRDGAQFQESVNACVEWLNEFFDTGDARVRGALGILEQAAASDLQVAVPSIEATLNAFDEYLRRQGGSMAGGPR